LLSDVEIREALEDGDIILDPPPIDGDIQPASIDVHLGDRFGFLRERGRRRLVRLTDRSLVDYKQANELALGPGQFALGQLAERLTLSPSMVARLEGKSSNGRKGLAIHVTAGFVDPGWDGILTIELFNASNTAYLLCKGDPIGQLAFDRLAVPSERPYGRKELRSRYQGSNEVQGGEGSLDWRETND
jgi:dCTP deaminase